MMSPADQRFALHATFLRALTPSDLESAVRTRQDQGEHMIALAAWLVQTGRITSSQRAAIDESIFAAADADPAPERNAPPAATVIEHSDARVDSALAQTHPSTTVPQAPSVGQLGRYELLEERGRGGMGVVYRAWDTELQREVALKTLLMGDQRSPELIERLLREARTAATLQHPGIVPIHDMGIVDGVPYFAMTFLRGRTFDRFLAESPSPPLRERVRVVADAARAVAHAHERKVIHRDLKPSNLLLDESGAVHVLDFGLARRLDEGARLTATGQMLGTPQYMPPEQIEGEHHRVGPASDVYALGAVLYEALTRRAPFEGQTVAEIVGRALSREPESPRRHDRQIHADLETICLKALDKVPQRRYPDARALADDLDRYLKGEPILAAPVAWQTRALRRMARQKLTSALIGALTLTAAWILWSGWDHAHMRARVGEALRAQAALVLDASLTLRRAGFPLDKAKQEYLPQLETAVAEAERAGVADGEPAYLLGRMHRALMHWEQASAAQQRAIEQRPDFVLSRYERAVLTARAYSLRMEELRIAALREAGARRTAPEPAPRGDIAFAIPDAATLETGDARARELRARLVEDLAFLPAASGGTEPARRACLQGLALSYGGRSPADRAEARRLLREAVELDPRLDEAWLALVFVLEEDLEIEAAILALDQAIQVDRGYAPFWEKRGALRSLWGRFRETRGESSQVQIDSALQDFDEAIRLHAGNPSIWVQRVGVRLDLVVRRISLGEDPREDLRACLMDVDAAQRLAPDHPEVWQYRAGIHTNWALWANDGGDDPRPHFDAATAAYDRAEALGSPSFELRIWRGNLHTAWARFLGQTGGDPRPQFALATAAYSRAVDLDPTSAFGYSNRANVLANQATWLTQRGEDAEREFATAEADFRRALEIFPGSAEIWQGSGRLQGAWAAGQFARGAGPDARLQTAYDHLSKALSINPANAEAWMQRAGITINRGVFAMQRGGDPRADFGLAVDDFSKALELNARNPEVWMWRGGLRSNWGAYLMQQGEDPEPMLALAAADYAQARALNPTSADICLQSGAVQLNRAAYRLDQGADPSALLVDAISACDQAIQINNQSAAAWSQRGSAHLNLARWRSNNDEDAEAAYREAIADYTHAIEINRAHVEAWTSRAQTWLGLADHQRERGKDAGEVIAAADADFTHALEINPHHAEALGDRGRLRYFLGRFEAALADFEAAFAANPETAAPLAGWRADCRVRLRTPYSLAGVLESLREAGRAFDEKRFEDAAALYDRAFGQLPAVLEVLDPAEQAEHLPREALGSSRGNLARIHARASAADNVTAEQAAHQRDLAFDSLTQAISLGYADSARLIDDIDLAPLRADPRWHEILRSISDPARK